MTELQLLLPCDGAVTASLQQHALDSLTSQSTDEPIVWDELLAAGKDRSQPSPVRFQWRAVAGADRYTLELRSRSGCRTFPASVNELAMVHLDVARPYSWRVSAMDTNGTAVARSNWSTFTTHAAMPRWIGVPGTTNVRDCGGWPAGGRRYRQGMIYRGSEMNAHVNIQPEGRAVLSDLGIKTDLDLRGADVAKPALEPPVTWLNIPVAPYAAIVEPEQQLRYQQVFAVLADATRYPIYFHCWGGADRGGTVAFLLGAVLGMAPVDLAKDYELTSLSVWGPRSRHSQEYQGLLATLATFAPGSSLKEQAECYLLEIGVSPEMIEQLRQNLLEQQSPSDQSPASQPH